MLQGHLKNESEKVPNNTIGQQDPHVKDFRVADQRPEMLTQRKIINMVKKGKELPKAYSVIQRHVQEGLRFHKEPTLSKGWGQVPTRLAQRQIYYNGGVPQFEIDGKKPAFMGAVKALLVLGNQSRDHIVPFDAIQNDLAIILNGILTGAMANVDLINFSEALFPNKAATASYGVMTNRRGKLITSLNNGATGSYEKHARALLSALNSSSENIRVGNAALNSSVGENLDADFLPGVFTVPGGPGLNVIGNGGAQTLPPGTQYLRLIPASESVLYEYQKHTTQDLSFVLNPVTNTQVSSVIAPTTVVPAQPVSGKSVVVFDPTGVGVPFYYS